MVFPHFYLVFVRKSTVLPDSRRSTYPIEWSYGTPISTPYKFGVISPQRYSWSRWWFQFLYFHPYLGKIPILTNIFQMGWNHQLEKVRMRQPKRCFGIYWRFEQIEIAITMEWMNSFSFNQTLRTKDVVLLLLGSGPLGGGDDATMYKAIYNPFISLVYTCQLNPIGWLYGTYQVRTSTRNIHWWGGSEA